MTACGRCRQPGRASNTDNANSIVHVVDFGEALVVQYEIDRGRVYAEFNRSEDTAGINPGFDRGDSAIVVCIHQRKHARSHADSGREVDLDGDAAALDGKLRRLRS